MDGSIPIDRTKPGDSSELTPADLASFERFRIPADLLAKAGVRRVSDSQARDVFGITGDRSKDFCGIIFPYFSAYNGRRTTARLRRDNPEIESGEEVNKYVAPWGDGRHLYIIPGSAAKLEKPGATIALVESEKAALALTAWADRTASNLVPMAMGGCYGWRGRIGRVENARGARVAEIGPLRDLTFCDGMKVYVLLDSNAKSNPKVRQAQIRLVAELRKRECEVLICELPLVENTNGPDDFLAVCGDEAMARVFSNAHSVNDFESETSDDALALRFTDLYGHDLKYTARWGQWNHFDGTCWKPDLTLYAFNLARDLCRAAANDEQPARATRILSAQTMAAVERLARADRRHAATIEQWDADPWLLNTPGGIVDLRTGSLRPVTREDYATQVTAVAPGGDHPVWSKFLSEVTGGDEDLEGYLQRASGYALTGTTVEHAFFFLHGEGGNGKTTFLNAIAGVMGGYAKTAPIETFIESASERHPTDLAGLRGARLVKATEVDSGKRWAESRLKLVTGGDSVSARFMRQDFFEFLPNFKLFIGGNQTPTLHTVDAAMKRRLHLIPFSFAVSETNRDLKLDLKLRAEWSGILQWMLDGCIAWQKDGLRPPLAVRSATANFFAEVDVVGRWFDDCCAVAKAWTRSADLYRSYTAWCQQQGEKPESAVRLTKTLKIRGFKPDRRSGSRIIEGITLRQT